MILFSNFINLTYYFAFIFILRGEDGEKEEKTKEDKGKQKLRQLHTHRYGEPEVQESVFWKNIIAYQQKLLVSCYLTYMFSCWPRHIPQYSNNIKTNSIWWTTFFYPPLSLKRTMKQSFNGNIREKKHVDNLVYKILILRKTIIISNVDIQRCLCIMENIHAFLW